MSLLFIISLSVVCIIIYSFSVLWSVEYYLCTTTMLCELIIKDYCTCSYCIYNIHTYILVLVLVIIIL